MVFVWHEMVLSHFDKGKQCMDGSALSGGGLLPLKCCNQPHSDIGFDAKKSRRDLHGQTIHYYRLPSKCVEDR